MTLKIGSVVKPVRLMDCAFGLRMVMTCGALVLPVVVGGNIKVSGVASGAARATAAPAPVSAALALPKGVAACRLPVDVPMAAGV